MSAFHPLQTLLRAVDDRPDDPDGFPLLVRTVKQAMGLPGGPEAVATLAGYSDTMRRAVAAAKEE